MKRLYLSVPSAVPVRQPSSTLQYFGLPSQPVTSRPLKMALSFCLLGLVSVLADKIGEAAAGNA